MEIPRDEPSSIVASGSSKVNQIGKLFAKYAFVGSQEELRSGSNDEDGEQKDCLKSLMFQGIYSRSRSISYTEGTCLWITQHSEYLAWLARNNSTLWIAGHPGVGKSTLMAYIADEYKGALHKTNKLTASFFFNKRGHEKEVSFWGLLASLLHEFSSKDNECLAIVTDSFRGNVRKLGPYGERWEWTIKELCAVFIKVIVNFATRLSVCIFIDALDEAESEATSDILNFLNDLALPFDHKSTGINLCISCRHYPNLMRDPDFRINVEAENSTDIGTHIHRKLTRLHIHPSRQKTIEHLLMSKSRGIFQWVDIVLEQVSKMLRNGNLDAEIERKLSELPSDLDSLYSGLLRSIEDDDQPQSLRLFQWICFSTQPLSFRQIRIALALDEDKTWKSLADFEDQRNTGIIQDLDQLLDRITSLSAGLVYVPGHERMRKRREQDFQSAQRGEYHRRHGDGSPAEEPRIKFMHQSARGFLMNDKLQFTHQSVQDFMKEKGLRLLSRTADSDCSMKGAAHFQISRSCLEFMNLSLESSVKDPKVSPGEHALITTGDVAKTARIQDYIENISVSDSFHQREKVDSRHRLLSPTYKGFDGPITVLQTNSWIENNRQLLMTRSQHLAPFTVSKDSHWFLLYCIRFWRYHAKEVEISGMALDDLVAILKTSSPEVIHAWFKAYTRTFPSSLRSTFQPIPGMKLLHVFSQYGLTSAVKCLVDVDDTDLNSVDESCRTPIHWAAQNGHIGVLRLLLGSHGMKPDKRDEMGQTPLALAVKHHHVENVRLLSQTEGVDVNNLDELNRPLLSSAILNSDTESVRVLMGNSSVDVSLEDEYRMTPLFYAVEKGNLKALELLLKHEKTSVNAEDQFGMTALSHAAQKGQTSVVRLLLDTGKVDSSIEDEYNMTALMYAEKNSFSDIVSLLSNIETRKTGQKRKRLDSAPSSPVVDHKSSPSDVRQRATLTAVELQRELAPWIATNVSETEINENFSDSSHAGDSGAYDYSS